MNRGGGSLYSVESLVNNRGHEVEHYSYDAYGKPVIKAINAGDVDYDGDMDSADNALIAACYNGSPPGCNACMRPIYDTNDNGVVNSSDLIGLVNPPMPAIITIPESSYGNPYAFTGQRMDFFDYNGQGVPQLQLYNYRAREYDPEHGRFMQRDPLEYVDGMNLYEYGRSNPNAWLDSSGTIVEKGNIISGHKAVFATGNFEFVGFRKFGGDWPMIKARINQIAPALIAGDREHGIRLALESLYGIRQVAYGFDPRGAGQRTRTNRFVYTCGQGFVDLGHYAWSATASFAGGLAVLPVEKAFDMFGAPPPISGSDISIGIGIGVEVIQSVWALIQAASGDVLDGNSTSAFSVEDLPSNRLGALAGQRVFQSTVLYRYVMNGERPSAWSIFWGTAQRGSLEHELRSDLERIGPVDPDRPLQSGSLAGQTPRKILDSFASRQGPFQNFGFDGKKIPEHGCLCTSDGRPR
jgi:RHS repeat-associated protein